MPTTPSAAGRRTLVAVSVLFAVNGLMVGVWGASLPSLRDRLDTDARGLAGLLVCAGLTAIVAMQVAGRVGDARGARAPTLIGGAVMIASMGLLATADAYPAAVVAALVFGAGNGTMDVAMNALAVDVERARGKATMSMFHGFFSVGNLAGAGVVLAVGRVVTSSAGRVASAVLTAAAVAALATWAAARDAPRVDAHAPDAAPARGGRALTPLALLLGVMAVCFGFTEGTGIDWSAVHVADVAHVDDATAALGLACVAGFMVVIRMFGDLAVQRVGRRAVVRFGAVTASAGYVITAFATPLGVILAGWCLVGLGVGMIAPQIYGLAGHLGGGRMLAVVTGFGYSAFLVGPAVIGVVAHATDLQRAMLVPLVSAVGLVVMSFRMPTIPADPR